MPLHQRHPQTLRPLILSFVVVLVLLTTSVQVSFGERLATRHARAALDLPSPDRWEAEAAPGESNQGPTEEVAFDEGNEADAKDDAKSGDRTTSAAAWESQEPEADYDLPMGYLGQPYRIGPLSHWLEAQCGGPRALIGRPQNLPRGLQQSSEGYVQGVPEEAGEFYWQAQCGKQPKLVRLVVTLAPYLSLSKPFASFSYEKGGPLPEEQSVFVAGGSANLPYEIVGTLPPWLTIQQRSGRTPLEDSAFRGDRLLLAANPRNLPIGVHRATLRLQTWRARTNPTLTVELQVRPAESGLPTMDDIIALQIATRRVRPNPNLPPATRLALANMNLAAPQPSYSWPSMAAVMRTLPAVRPPYVPPVMVPRPVYQRPVAKVAPARGKHSAFKSRIYAIPQISIPKLPENRPPIIKFGEASEKKPAPKKSEGAAPAADKGGGH